MVRQKCVCLLLLLLSPIMYPICWWPMRFSGWVFWTEPNEMMKHMFLTVGSIFRPNMPSLKQWIYILLISAVAFLPYWMINEAVTCIWIVYFK